MKLQTHRDDLLGLERRSLAGAWIETLGAKVTLVETDVAPSRERGLKRNVMRAMAAMNKSLPRGSVD